MLWMTRTPLRVSLFGGGTDYPEYFHRRPGAVIGFAINQYIHIGALRLNPFLGYNYRVAYSKLENSRKQRPSSRRRLAEALGIDIAQLVQV